MFKTLYELTGQFKELEAIDDMDEDALADTLEGLTGEIEAKANAVAVVINGFSGEINHIDSEIKRLQARKKTAENKVKYLKDYIKMAMQAIGKDKAKGQNFNITLAKGKDIVNIVDQSKLPQKYLRVSTSVAPEKKLILDDLKAGIDIPGATKTKSEPFIKIT